MQEAGPTTGPTRSVIRALLVVVLAIAACYVVWSFTRPIDPIRARRNATLHTLERLAAKVNEYHQLNGELPRSVADLDSELGTAANYELLMTSEEDSFVVVADRVFRDEPGQGFRFGCDQDLQIVKLPPNRVAGRVSQHNR